MLSAIDPLAAAASCHRRNGRDLRDVHCGRGGAPASSGRDVEQHLVSALIVRRDPLHGGP